MAQSGDDASGTSQMVLGALSSVVVAFFVHRQIVAVGSLVHFVLGAVYWVVTFWFMGLTLGVGLAFFSAGPKMMAALKDTVDYYRCFFYYWRGGSLRDCKFFPDRLQARLHVFSLVLALRLWDKPHYRNGTFQHDMKQNLRNVALPGTGISLKWVVITKLGSYVFLLCVYPLVAVAGAVICSGANAHPEDAAEVYAEQLLMPKDWFSFWQLNCRFATWHSYVTKETDFGMEDKWTFLTTAEKLGIPVTPCMQVPRIVCKHRNEEGGLGFHSFRNATVGGDWIIQERLSNSPFLASLLPENAPLSTIRIVTASRGGLKSGTPQRDEVSLEDIRPLTCVWRAGHAGAPTDHGSVLFDVDHDTGKIQKGTTNDHWYQLGLSKIPTTPWTSEHNITHHPDCGAEVEGHQIPDIAGIMALVRDAHFRMMPHVPLAGWDVALVSDGSMLLLEANLSCNFFRGHFDQPAYFRFMEEYFLMLEERERQGVPEGAASGEPDAAKAAPKAPAPKQEEAAPKKEKAAKGKAEAAPKQESKKGSKKATPKGGQEEEEEKVPTEEELAEMQRKKRIKAAVKEGGKRGVEIEGAADMGGLQFFCTSVDEPQGDMEILRMCLDAMNAEADPSQEERKGGSGHIGKMIFSAGTSQLAVYAYVPKAKQEELSCGEWLEHVLKTQGGQVAEKGAEVSCGVVLADSAKGVFPLKIREPMIVEANNYLRARGLFPEDDDDDDEMVFGDDDFPS